MLLPESSMQFDCQERKPIAYERLSKQSYGIHNIVQFSKSNENEDRPFHKRSTFSLLPS